jgi:hypothetical protein
LTGATTASEIRLQQMRERVNVTELAILDSEEVSIGPRARPVATRRLS